MAILPAVFPLVSVAFFPNDLRKLHEESKEHKEVRREQFKQDILEKRKEVFTKWADHKQDIEKKFNKERERVRSEFDLRRSGMEGEGSTSQAIATEEREELKNGKFFSVIRKSTQDIIHLFSPLKDFFGSFGK